MKIEQRARHMSTPITPSITTKAAMQAKIAKPLDGTFRHGAHRGARRAPAYPPRSAVAVMALLERVTAQRGAHFAQCFDDFRPPCLRPFVPIGSHGVDRTRDFIRLRLREGIPADLRVARIRLPRFMVS